MMDIKYITILYPGGAKCEVFQTDSAPSGLNRSGIYFASSPFSYYIKIFTNLLITTRRAGQKNLWPNFFFPICWTPRHRTAKTNNRIHQEHNLFYHLDDNSGYFFEKTNWIAKDPSLPRWNKIPTLVTVFFSMASLKNTKIWYFFPFSTHPIVGENINSQTSDIGGKLARLKLSLAILYYILSSFISSAWK